MRARLDAPLRALAALAVAACVVVPATLLQAETDGAAPADTAPATEQPAETGPAAAVRAEQQALERIEESIELSQERAAALRAEIEALQGDRARQNAALIAAAQRVKAAEADVTAMEDRLGDLIVEEMEVRGRLDAAGGDISGVLSALARISRSPPPALIVDPSDALGSARSAMLISAIVPQLQLKADALTADLRQLEQVKAAARAEEERIRANFEVLAEERLRIATLISARREGEDRATAELAAEEAEAEALAAQAESLKQLIDDLTRRARAVAVAAEATATANTGGSAPRLDAETIRMALANVDRDEPAIPFAQARGYLTMPTSGVSVVEYGAADGYGGIATGLSLVTRAEATVVAPADGWVLYTGDYLNYGRIIIINAGQDYTILLAGLENVSVRTGQFVRMGEPVGTMGSRTIGRTVSTSAGTARPTLYIEMRRNNEPIDPTGWWAPPETSTQSG